MSEEYFSRRNDYMPWYEFTPAQKEEQLVWQKTLAARFDAAFGEDSFVSPLARLYGISRLRVGQGSFIAAGALVREASLTMGDFSSVNSECYLQGPISIGNYVRIAPHVNIIAMNHSFADTSLPICRQPLSHKGITIEDDVWLGAGVSVLDGVRVGAHSIVGAGAVVTKDIPPWSIAVGNPARAVRSRLGETRAPEALAVFAAQVREQLPAVLAYYTDKQGELRNTPDSEPTIRAWCDAAELLAMFGLADSFPDRDRLVARIRSLQKPDVDYDVLTVGYALEVLGEKPSAPFSQADEIGAALEDWLSSLPWDENAWGAGAAVDHFATALYFNQKYFGTSYYDAPLFGHLLTRQNPVTGLWGTGAGDDQHLPVNGYYRLTRGSFAQFGLPVPRPEAAVDAVLRQSRRVEYFGPDRGNACDVLDIIHPLWLCARQTDYRREEGRLWARAQIGRILGRWQTGRGFSFELETAYPATLQGTEMWLSVLYLLCDYCGQAELLCYAPQGVHRTKAVWAPELRK